MRPIFNILTFALIVVGFFVPIAWGAALVTFVLAIGASPGGKREDGKARSGGLLGGMWDDAVISHKKQKGQMPKDDLYFLSSWYGIE